MPANFNNMVIDGSAVFRLVRARTPPWDVDRMNAQAAANAYETAVVNELRRIQGNAAGGGGILLQHLAPVPQGHIRIVPVSNPRDTGALAASMMAATERGMPIAGTTAASTNLFLSGTGPGIGTGAGSRVAILYNPGDWTFLNTMIAATGAADEVLFHELFHAHRYARGRSSLVRTGDNYDEVEEFSAVMLTDIYASARGSMLLRGSHHFGADDRRAAFVDFPLDEGAESISARMAARYRDRLESLFWTDPGLYGQFARLTTRFNPLRDHLHPPPLVVHGAVTPPDPYAVFQTTLPGRRR
jgi:hypothetical protein